MTDVGGAQNGKLKWQTFFRPTSFPFFFLSLVGLLMSSSSSNTWNRKNLKSVVGGVSLICSARFPLFKIFGIPEFEFQKSMPKHQGDNSSSSHRYPSFLPPRDQNNPNGGRNSWNSTRHPLLSCIFKSFQQTVSHPSILTHTHKNKQEIQWPWWVAIMHGSPPFSAYCNPHCPLGHR